MRFVSKWKLLHQCIEAGMICYTKKARHVVFYAAEEASQNMANELTPEHLLVGLIRADASLAGRFGLPAIVIKTPSKCRSTTGFALSESARRVILLAAEERNRLCHKHIGTEHLLLGIIRGGSDCARLLLQHGLTTARIHQLVRQHELAVGGATAEPIIT
jgi:ATP-dependent Clp protease ATP-binding subunit ClpC